MDTLDNETNIRMLALFDNEEVGSQSAQGAMSSIVEWTLRRIAASGMYVRMYIVISSSP